MRPLHPRVFLKGYCGFVYSADLCNAEGLVKAVVDKGHGNIYLPGGWWKTPIGPPSRGG